MEKKKTTVQQRKAIEIALVLFCVGTILFSWMTDMSLIKIPEELLMEISSIEDFLFTIFSVQASIATVSIAVISIITGFANECYLGVSISEFITTIKPCILTHKRLIVISLLLVICSYIAVAFKWINLCISLFFISIIITILLVSDVYIIFGGAPKVQRMIRSYVLDHYDDARIEAIKKELIKAVEINSISVIDQDMEILKSIFSLERHKVLSGQSLIGKLEDVIVEIVCKAIRQHNPSLTNKMLVYINDIYLLANTNEEAVVELDLWDRIHREYYKALQDLTDEHIRENASFFGLHHELYRNLAGKSGPKTQDSYIMCFASWAYSALIAKKTDMDVTVKAITKRRIYEMVAHQLLYNRTGDNDEIKLLQVRELCQLLRAAVDSGDAELFTDHFFKNYKYHAKDEYYRLSFLITIAYLYYLAAREKIESGEKVQANARAILQENRQAIGYFYDYMDVLNTVRTHREFFYSTLSRWEQMSEGEVKWMIMQHVVDDFLLFTACAKYWDKISIGEVVGVVAKDGMFSLYNRYFSQNKESIIAKLLTEFMSFFCTGTIREDFASAKLEILHDIFNEKYMQEAIRESQNQRVADESIREYAEKLQMSVAEYAANNFAMFRFYTCEIMEELPITAEPEINVISMRIPHAIIKDNTLLSDLQNNMAEQMMVVFLRRIIGNLAFEEVKYDRKDKQKTLIDMVEGLPIVPDVVIGERDTFWSESDQKMLQKYTNGMRHLEYPGGYNYYFIIDSSKIGFSIENIRISYANEEVESILARCEMREDGKYLLNITNDIFIPFSKDDLIKYVHDTEKVLTLSADIKYRIRAAKVGAGIEIVT